jgi:hypothetical protein
MEKTTDQRELLLMIAAVLILALAGGFYLFHQYFTSSSPTSSPAISPTAEVQLSPVEQLAFLEKDSQIITAQIKSLGAVGQSALPVDLQLIVSKQALRKNGTFNVVDFGMVGAVEKISYQGHPGFRAAFSASSVQDGYVKLVSLLTQSKWTLLRSSRTTVAGFAEFQKGTLLIKIEIIQNQNGTADGNLIYIIS